jgi:predicted small secreted protein
MTIPSSLLRRSAAIILSLGALFLAGCNTMDGAGKDIEKAGEKIQDASEKKE